MPYVTALLTVNGAPEELRGTAVKAEHWPHCLRGFQARFMNPKPAASPNSKPISYFPMLKMQ